MLVAAMACSPAALASGTAANTSIPNTATATYVDPLGATQVATSNTVTVTVAEILDVTVADNGDVSVLTPQAGRALAFTVTNTGNAAETFELSYQGVGGDSFDPELAGNTPLLYLDANGNGTFESATDTPYSSGGNDPVIAADGHVVVFFVSNIPSSRANGDAGTISLRATAVTASANGDPAGTVYAAAGPGNVDAVVGASTASSVDPASYVVSATTTTLVKSSTVLDPFNGSQVVPGSVITYTLTFTLAGSGSITTARIVDPIPAGAGFVSGSLKLNGVGLSDVAGDDAGRYNTSTSPAQVEVNLASPLAAPSTQTVVFKVTVN